ncbi:MAG: methionyl-tRNA formyltransferase [Candidatus Daviesbacteria bacterium]
MKDLKIIFFGTPEFVLPVLKTLEENFSLVGIVTAPDRKVGRKQILTPSPIKAFTSSARRPRVALQGDALILTPDKLDDKVTQSLQNLSPDLFVVAAYGKIIPKEILDVPKYGALNIHPSLLPKERGASPIQSVILKGEIISGLTIMKMDEKMDHGPIIYTSKFSLSDQDTFATLSKFMFEEVAAILPKIIEDFVAGKIKPKPQNHKLATFNKLVKKENGYFEISNPPSPEMLDRIIRAYYPWPTAWTNWHGKIIKFLPGGMIQMEGKKPVKLADFLRGYPDFPLKKLL